MRMALKDLIRAAVALNLAAKSKGEIPASQQVKSLAFRAPRPVPSILSSLRFRCALSASALKANPVCLVP